MEFVIIGSMKNKNNNVQDLLDYAADLAYQGLGFVGKPKK
jgi:hypothetical protein